MDIDFMFLIFRDSFDLKYFVRILGSFLIFDLGNSLKVEFFGFE